MKQESQKPPQSLVPRLNPLLWKLTLILTLSILCPISSSFGQFEYKAPEIETLAPKEMFKEILADIQIAEDAEAMSGINGVPQTKEPKIAKVSIIKTPTAENGGLWIEGWEIQRIGYTIIYQVTFTPKGKGEKPTFAIEMPGKRVGY